MIAVFGATGQVGGKVAAMLVENGVPVRIMVRSPEKAAPLQSEGADVVKGSLYDADDIRNTLEGCDGAFLMSPLNSRSDNVIDEEISVGRNYAEAIKDSDINHVVYLSVVSSQEKTGIPHFDSKAVIEDSISETGVDHTFLRPSYFMENFYQQWPLIHQMGVISYPFPPDVPLPMVATEDVAYAAVQSLIRGGRGREEFDILGPKSYTMSEAAGIIGSIIGKEIRYLQATPEQAIESMMANGLSRVASEDIVIMFDKYQTMEFKGDRNRVYDEFNFDPTTLETVISTAAGALRAEAG